MGEKNGTKRITISYELGEQIKSRSRGKRLLGAEVEARLRESLEREDIEAAMAEARKKVKN